MTKVFITDTILRDAHQCLIATRMRTDDMLGACAKLDKVGYWSLEVWGGATFDACVRFLKEDPWERLRQLRRALPNTRLQMLLRGQNLLGYRHYPDDVVQTFVQKSVENGIDVFRIFDALNDVRNLSSSIDAVKKLKKHAQGTVAYTTSPVHNTAVFVKMAKELESMGCDSIAIKDMAGLLTPSAAAELMQAFINVVKVPVHLHSHATSGLSALCHMKAIENGCRHIDTAISSFSEGASHACTESMVVALRGTEYDTGLDLSLLQDIGDYFHQVRKKYKRFESEGTGIDTRVQVYQVPGGMISNLHNQLKQQNALDKLEDVQNEIPRVRADLGYPPLVTPTSQIVGTQALLNVLSGERYKTITNEVKLYLQGRYGKAPGVVDAAVRQKAIGNEDVIDVRPADLIPNEFSQLEKEIGELADCTEDVLIYAMFPDVGRDYLKHRAEGTLEPEPLELPGKVGGEEHRKAPTEMKITMHGETYHIKITGTGRQQASSRPFFVSIDGIPEEILLEEISSSEDKKKETATSLKATESGRPRATKPGDICASMPGTVVDVLVKVGDLVTAGDPVLVIEAMKMETEIQATISGTILAIHVSKGESVNPDEALVEIKG